MTKIKKFNSVFVALAMLVSMVSFSTVSFAVDSASISMGPVYSYNVDDGIGAEELTEINAGDTIAIPVTLSDRNGIKAAAFKITWDSSFLSMSKDYNEDDDIYAAYPEVSTLFNQVFSINVEDGSVMVAGSRKSAFSSSQTDFSLGYLVFTVLDNAAGKNVSLSFADNGTKTCFNDGAGDKAFTTADSYEFSVAGGIVKQKHTVIFENEGVKVSEIQVEDGEKIGVENIPADAEKAGYTFDGWFIDEVKVTADTVVTANVTAIAKFTVISSGGGDETLEDGEYGIKLGPVYPYDVDSGIGSEALTEINVGDTIAIPLTLSDRNGVKAASFKVAWDSTKLSMSKDYNEDDDIYAAYPEVSSLFNQVFSINVTDSTVMVAGARKSAFSSSEVNFSLGYLVFTVLDKAVGREITLTFVDNGSSTCYNDGTGDKAFALAKDFTFKVAGEATVNYFNVTFKNEDGTIYDKKQVEEGTKITILPIDPSKTGYTFDGWYVGDNKITNDTVVNSDITAEAKFTINNYTVKFMNGTETAATHTVAYNEAIGAGRMPADPSKTGYTFDGWYVGENKITKDTVVTGNITAEAKFTINNYTVKFMNGTETAATHTVAYNEAIGAGRMPTDPSKTGYTFDGWYTGETKVTADTVVTGDITATAKFTAKDYTVTFVNGTETTTATVKYNEAIGVGNMPADPSKTGYTFVGWYAGETAVTEDTVVTDNITAEAKFTINEYTVTFTGKEGAAIGEPKSVKHGNKVTTVPTAPEVPGYEFVQWTVDGAVVADPADYEITKETEFKAEYRSLDPNTITDIEVVDADGKVVEAIEIPYGTAIDEIAAAIREAITVNEIKVEGKNNNVAYTTDPNEITERVDSIVIKAAGFAKTIALTYATEAIKIEATEKVSVPFKNHEGKDDPAAIAEYVKGKLTVTVYDIYGIEIEDAEYAVSDYDKETESVTVSYEGAKDVTVAVTLKAKSTGTSAASGTVVRPSTSVPTTKPGTDKPGTEEPGTEEPGTDVPGTDKPGTEEPGTEEPGTDVPGTNAPFTDITADDWAYDAIKDLYDRGVISGDATNTVRPADGITREEVSKIILNARGIEVDADAAIDATDANTVSDWAAGYVATAIKEGILKGYDDGTIQAGKVVTRAEFAAIIVRALGATSEYTASSFSDITADDWYAADVECAKSLGIVTGYEDGSFKGDQPVTRREAFVMVQRMIKLIEALEK